MSIRTFLSACYKKKERLRLTLSILLYNRHLKRVLPRILEHRPVRIMFYVNNLSMWKSDKLLMLLKNDSNFEPFIVSYIYPTDSPKRKDECEKNIARHFGSLGVEVSSGFNYTRNKRYPVRTFHPDILFYPQPYRNSLMEIPRNVLLSYIPYCFEMEDSRRFYNTLYQNICWKIFVASPLHKELKEKYNINHGINVVVAGNPLADYFFDGHTPTDEIWPVHDSKLKRIIWAPHHSILPDDTLDYSNFLKIADQMLETAKKYADRVQFVFKPHPMLREKLYKVDSWGINRTDSYYDTWKSLPNCNFADGNYVDLFMTSDALIHDCSSFTAEYLYVNKPVMYLTDKQRVEVFNTFADACFQVHYHGSKISEIESFVDNVIDGIDPMAEKRTKFINDQLIPKGNEPVASIIYNELHKILE